MPLPRTLIAVLLIGLPLLCPSVAGALRAGDILVADYIQGLIAVDPVTGNQSYVTQLAGGIAEVVCDGMGNIYVSSNGGGHTIFKVDASTGSVTTVVYSYLGHQPLDVLPDGSLIAQGDDGLVRVDPSSGTRTLIVPRLQVYGLAVADAHTAYVMCAPPGSIADWYPYRLDLATGDTVRVSNVSFSNPGSMAIESSSSFVVLEQGDPLGKGPILSRVFPASGAVTRIASGPPFERPIGVAIESSGRILVADTQGSDPNCRRPPVTCLGVLHGVDPVSGARTVVSTQDKFYWLSGVEVYGGSGATPVRKSSWGRIKTLYR